MGNPLGTVAVKYRLVPASTCVGIAGRGMGFATVAEERIARFVCVGNPGGDGGSGGVPGGSAASNTAEIAVNPTLTRTAEKVLQNFIS